MTGKTHSGRKRAGAAASALLAMCAAAACGGDDNQGYPDAEPPPDIDAGGGQPDATLPDAGPGPTAARASKSSAIAITDDDLVVAMVNPDDDSLSTFSTTGNSLLARVTVGDEPSAVVVHPDRQTAFVANRADATVVKVSDIRGADPVVSAPVEVGSEPTGLALTPSGKTLFVAEWAEGRISVIDTATMTVTGRIDNPANPYTVAVTNDGDDDDDDELVVVPEFFGQQVAGGEATDTGRTGLVRIYRVSDLGADTPITFAPIDSGFVPVDGQPAVMTAPNQLAAVAIQGGKIYVTSVSASPQGPIKFNGNVFPVLYVGDLDSRVEDRSSVGTADLARLVFDQLGDGETRFALADLIDLDFIGSSGVSYVLARGADVIQRVVYDPATGISIGSQFNVQIDIGTAPAGSSKGCQNPIGIVTARNAPRAYVNCWVSRRLGVVDLSNQALSATIEASPAPSGDEETAVSNGKRFFYTGRGRWSKDAWSSCASCHPGGYTDNITWAFGAGPRESTSLDGSFSHGPGPQKQRVFNWSAIFDEVHDFERNTRGTSGGLGAITSSATAMCGTLAQETAISLNNAAGMPIGGLDQPLKELQDGAGACTNDWDEVDAYMRTIRPPRGRRGLDAESVARGALLFGDSTPTANNGRCSACHGGAGWTVSRRFYTPSSATNTALKTAPFAKPDAWPDSWNFHTVQIALQPAAAGTAADVAPAQVACVIRNVGTFGVPGDADGTTALEKRDNGNPAQGLGGYNVPSLYGLSVGAPYLHHGQAGSLEELFDDAAWSDHLLAGNPVFLTTGDAAAQKRDLINYLLSIDASTAEQAIPAGFDGCPSSFP